MTTKEDHHITWSWSGETAEERTPSQVGASESGKVARQETGDKDDGDDGDDGDDDDGGDLNDADVADLDFLCVSAIGAT